MTQDRKSCCSCVLHDGTATWGKKGWENENGRKNLVWRAWSFTIQIKCYEQEWRRTKAVRSRKGHPCASRTGFSHSLSAAEANWNTGAARDRRGGCVEQAGVGTGKLRQLPLPPLLCCLLSWQAQSSFHCLLLLTRGRVIFTPPNSATDTALTQQDNDQPFLRDLLCCPLQAVFCFIFPWSQPCHQIYSYQEV